jgi:hypothetical protein
MTPVGALNVIYALACEGLDADQVQELDLELSAPLGTSTEDLNLAAQRWAAEVFGG